MIEWYYLCIISSITMGLATIIEKSMLKVEHATAFSATFSIIIAAASLVFLPMANFNISLLGWALLFIISLFSTVTYLLTARVYKHGSMAASSTAFSTLPAPFIAIMAFFFLGEALSPLQYFSIVGILVLTYIMMGGSQFDSARYKYMVVIDTALSAISTVIFKYALGTSVNPYTAMIVLSILMAIEFMVWISVKYNGVNEVVQTLKSAELPMLGVVALTVIYRITYYVALSLAPASVTWPLRNALFIVITVVAGVLVFKEGSLLKKLALSALVMFFAYLLVV